MGRSSLSSVDDLTGGHPPRQSADDHGPSVDGPFQPWALFMATTKSGGLSRRLYRADTTEKRCFSERIAIPHLDFHGMSAQKKKKAHSNLLNSGILKQEKLLAPLSLWSLKPWMQREVQESRTRQREQHVRTSLRVRAPRTPQRGAGCPHSTTAGGASKTSAGTNMGGREEALRSRKPSTVSAGVSWWTGAVPKISKVFVPWIVWVAIGTVAVGKNNCCRCHSGHWSRINNKGAGVSYSTMGASCSYI